MVLYHTVLIKQDGLKWNPTVPDETGRPCLKLDGDGILSVNFMCYDRPVWELFDRSLSDILNAGSF